MRYQKVSEIETLYNIDKMIKRTRILWYKLAEGFEIVPNSYIDFNRFISKYEKNIFCGWKLSIKNDGSLSLTTTIQFTSLFIQIDRWGKETYRILPLKL